MMSVSFCCTLEDASCPDIACSSLTWVSVWMVENQSLLDRLVFIFRNDSGCICFGLFNAIAHPHSSENVIFCSVEDWNFVHRFSIVLDMSFWEIQLFTPCFKLQNIFINSMKGQFDFFMKIKIIKTRIAMQFSKTLFSLEKNMLKFFLFFYKINLYENI